MKSKMSSLLKGKELILLFLIIFLFFSCEKWNLDEQNFIELEVTGIEVLSLDSIRISGLSKGLISGNIKDHGFIWTTRDEDPPTIFFKKGIQTLGVKTKEESTNFSSIIKVEPNTSYQLRAYATTDEEDYIYSDPTLFESGSGSAISLSLNYVGGLSLEAKGRLSGTQEGFVAVEHGFCWSIVNPFPTLTDEVLNLGQRINDEEFSGTIEGLENERLHYIRAYAILILDFKRDTVYGAPLVQDGNLNYWTAKSNFIAAGRIFAVAFSIGDKAYVGTGFSQSFLPVSDFWEYDPIVDAWTQKADFGGGKISRAVGFSIGDKGYVGTGVPEGQFPQENYSNELWEYDPSANNWIQKADFEGGGRNAAVGFSIGNKGYIGTGRSDSGSPRNKNDLWEYDPQNDAWTPKANFGGERRRSAAGFSIGQKGYIGTGFRDDIDAPTKDFWEYNPQTDIWTQKTDFPGMPNSFAVGLSIGDLGYIGTGYLGQSDAPRNDFWEYNPQTDTWTIKAAFGGVPILGASAFSIHGKGYIVFGEDENREMNLELWEFDP